MYAVNSILFYTFDYAHTSTKKRKKLLYYNNVKNRVKFKKYI